MYEKKTIRAFATQAKNGIINSKNVSVTYKSLDSDNLKIDIN